VIPVEHLRPPGEQLTDLPSRNWFPLLIQNLDAVEPDAFFPDGPQFAHLVLGSQNGDETRLRGAVCFEELCIGEQGHNIEFHLLGGGGRGGEKGGH